MHGPYYFGRDRCRFNIWTPHRQRIDLVLNGQRRLPMQRDEPGIWSMTLDEVPPGIRYRFCLDEAMTRLEPRLEDVVRALCITKHRPAH